MNEINPTTQATQAQALKLARKTLAMMKPWDAYDDKLLATAISAIDALAQAVPQPTPSQPSEGESVGAQPAMEWISVGEVVPMPGTTGFTMAVFPALDVPVGSLLYVPAAPNQEQGQAK